jgi:hypothetical protein
MYPVVVLRKMNVVIGMYCDDYCSSENHADVGRVSRRKLKRDGSRVEYGLGYISACANWQAHFNWYEVCFRNDHLRQSLRTYVNPT